MKRIYFVLMVLVFITSSVKSQVSFTKEYHNYTIDTTINVSILYKGNFYCLKANGQIFLIGQKNCTIDTSYTDNSQKINLLTLYLHNDTLIALNKTDTYYYNTSTKNWVFLRKGWFIPPAYEDEDYLVTSTCSGEWGGSLHFRNKKTNNIYECASTCTINVNKYNGNYLVTASLAHMAGFSNIFVITDPLKLKPFAIDSLNKLKEMAKKQKKTYVSYYGADETNSKQGTTQLIDTIGVLILTNFNYNSKNYYLVNKGEKVWIDTIENKKLSEVLDISNEKVFDYHPENRFCGNTQIYSFKNERSSGFVVFDSDKISFYSFDRNHN